MTHELEASGKLGVSDVESARRSLSGTWRLVSFFQTFPETGETVNTFGERPVGFIHYGHDGRMIVLIVGGERPCPASLAAMTDKLRAELFQTMVAYAGTYLVDKSTVTHRLDISWNEVFTGDDQIRNISFEGTRLIMSTNPQPRSQDGRVAVSTLIWER